MYIYELALVCEVRVLSDIYIDGAKRTQAE